MYLKRLSLSGFKSFANATTLEFGPGITAIVGPNGSGKSNVVDGMLWAMGERSNKALRGHAATDVIFNGSSNRKPLGLAEVSLFFDNEDNALPLEYKEVQVARRIFRDGEGEYSINKTNCRLRDVLDLFLDTGIGPDSFSIISQGEIDAILSARPEDRRNLLEGAAGVQKYHARRGETRRKLDRVQADLTRVADIMFELESQLEPLSLQAELAREYDNYVARLRVLQLAILARDYETRTRRMENLREAKVSFAARVQTGTAEIATHETDESAINEKLRGLESVLERVQGELTSVVTRLTTTEGDIAVARERRRALTEQQEFQAREIGLLRARIEATQQKLGEDRSTLEAARRESSTLSAGAAEAEAKLGAANARLSEATRELQTLQAQVIELMRSSQAQREAAAGGRAEAAALQNRIAELLKLAEELEHEKAQIEAAQASNEKALGEVRGAHQVAAQKIEEARNRWQSTQATQRAAAEAQSAARENRSALTSRLNALRELEENLEGVQGGARAILGAVKRGQLEDRYTLVADALRAPRELEQAIEVALGAGVHNLICNSDADAKTGIGWLKKNQAGRATFLPIPNLRPSHVSEKTRALLRERGVRGLASELVECSRDDLPAIEYLLGRVIIVDDLDTAVNLARRADFGIRFVTLEGELVLPAGAITGGQGKQKSSGLLARKRELDELGTKLQSLESELQNLAGALQEASAQVEVAHDAWRVTQDEASDLKNQIARQEREIEHTQSAARRVLERLAAVGQQHKIAQENLDKKLAQQREQEGGAAALDEEASALDTRVLAAQEQVAARQREREQVASDVADVRAQYSATTERLSAMTRAINESERAIEEAEVLIVSKQEGIEKAGGEDAQLVTREADLVALLAQLKQRHEELEADFNRIRRERQQGMARLETIGVHLREGRSTLHEAEEELHRVEVRIAATETEIADMQRRFEEEFELSLEEGLTYGAQIEQKNLALDEIEVLKDKVSALGNINVGAVQQYEQVKERLEFLSTQRADLEDSKAQHEEIITYI
jgi:chromosome segregation protein